MSVIFHYQIRRDCFHFLHNFPSPTTYNLPAATFNDRYCCCTKLTHLGKSHNDFIV